MAPRKLRLRDGLVSSTVSPVLTDGRSRSKMWPCTRSEEHTSELQSPCNLVCRLLLEKIMTVDSSVSLYVVDAAVQNGQMFNDKDQLLFFFFLNGAHPRAFTFPPATPLFD